MVLERVIRVIRAGIAYCKLDQLTNLKAYGTDKRYYSVILSIASL
jgi:hypothetical protein